MSKTGTEQGKIFSLEELGEEDSEILTEVLGTIIESSAEDSPIKKRLEFLGRFVHDVKNGLTLPRGFFYFLAQEEDRLPGGIYYQVEGKGSDERLLFMDRVDGLIDDLAREVVAWRFAVGVQLEDVFEQLGGEKKETLEEVEPRDIICLVAGSVQEILEEGGSILGDFFKKNPTESEQAQGLRSHVIGGLQKAIEITRQLKEEFLALPEAEVETR